MIFTMLPMTSIEAFADPAVVKQGQCGDNVYYSFDESTGVLTITGTGPMYDRQYLDTEDYYYSFNLKKAVISEGVTSISWDFFWGCTNLECVEIPDSVINIGEYAFYNTGIKEIRIPSGIKKIADGTFSECAYLKSVNIPDGVIEIENGAFCGCSRLSSITIPDSVTTIGDGVFLQNYTLRSITIPNSVTSLGACFENCSSLENVYLPDNIKEIGVRAFDDCGSLKNLILPEKVTNIAFEAFGHHTSLDKIYIPKSVTSINEE